MKAIYDPQQFFYKLYATIIILLTLTIMAAGQQPVIKGDWTTQANDYSANVGKQYTFSFPAGGTVSGRVWGTDVYTYDCSIASAAVHAGLITEQNGGTVTIEIRAGQSSYRGSTRNGVTSKDWGAFGGSFVFIKGTLGEPIVQDRTVITGHWNTQANDYSANVGKQYTFYFPPNGTISGGVWGTDIYTYDCSIASAAVHAGLITAKNGGTVTIEIRKGQSSYSGSTRNGVTSKDWGPFGGSFVFVVNGNPVESVNTTVLPPVKTDPSIIQGNWTMQANDYSANAGKRYTFFFPPNGSISSRVWGTDIYTYDCSIASAAVHAGLITTKNGGTVTIEIRAGQPSYKGSTRNGVTSNAYGAFGGSFVFVVNGIPVEPVNTTVIPPVKTDPAVIQGTWSSQGNEYYTNIGKRYTFFFPANGTISGRVWGTDIYTYDCSIASAAVHAGLITAKNGGKVTIEIRGGQPSYKSSTRNGVTSNAWGAYGGSFVFVVNGIPIEPGTTTVIPPEKTDPSVIQGTWTTQANDYSANIGKQYTFYFPPGGTVSGRVWGTDVYTYDCSIASAAVHAGLIKPQYGGTVTIEIRQGQSSYTGSTRNGVTSKDWGAFGGSFVFVNAISIKPVVPAENPKIIQGDWGTQANDYSANVGKRYTFHFPPGGTISGRVWGTDVYTYDCSIASAAVHAGLITAQNGGTVTIEIRPGQASYSGCTRNGVASKDWGGFGGSFVFVTSNQ